jgi:hypothetical protein
VEATRPAEPINIGLRLPKRSESMPSTGVASTRPTAYTANSNPIAAVEAPSSWA